MSGQKIIDGMNEALRGDYTERTVWVASGDAEAMRAQQEQMERDRIRFHFKALEAERDALKTKVRELVAHCDRSDFHDLDFGLGLQGSGLIEELRALSEAKEAE